MEMVSGDAILLCHSCSRSVAHGFERFSEDPSILDTLRANAEVLSSERAAIFRKMEDANSALQELDREIVMATATLNALQSRRQSIETVVSKMRSLFAPIRRLPREILLKVFTMECVEVDPLMEGYVMQRATAMEISQTCHFWRELMLNAPELWATLSGISLFYPDRKCSNPNRRPWLDSSSEFKVDRQLLALYLERSQGRQLDVNLEGSNKAAKADLSPFFHNDCNSRIESLVIDPNILSGVKTFMFSPPRPVLKCLTLLTREGHLEGTHVLQDFSQTSLTEVNFRNIDLRRFNLPWQSLSTVSFWFCGLDSIEFLEEVAPQITCLRLGNMDPTPCRKVTFPKVQRLVVASGARYIVPLHVLWCPDVQEVDLLVEPGQTLQLLPKAIEPRQGSIPQLRRLRLDVSEIDVSKLHSVVGELKDIQILSLNFTWTDRGACHLYNTTPEEISLFFNLSTSRSDDVHALFLPKLEEISVTAYRIVIDSNITDFLTSRRAAEIPSEQNLKRFKLSVRPLRRVIFPVKVGHGQEGPAPPSEVVCSDGPTLESLRKLRREGLHICINSDWSPLDDLKCLG